MAISYDEVYQDFIDEATEVEGEEGKALAENIAHWMTKAVRKTRNDLEMSLEGRKTIPEITAYVDKELPKGYEDNIENSFKPHLRAIQRQLADVAAIQLKAQSFMGVQPNMPPVVLTFEEYTGQNMANLARNPKDKILSIPIPPEYDEEIVDEAQRFLSMTPKQRDAEMAKAKRELLKASGARD